MSRRNLNNITLILLALTILLLKPLPSDACGPFFPNRMMLGGDDLMLRAPQPDFAIEIERLKNEIHPITAYSHVETADELDNYPESILEIDVAELEEALNDSDADSKGVLEAYRECRTAIVPWADYFNSTGFYYPSFQTVHDEWLEVLSGPSWFIQNNELPEISDIPDGIPDEFYYYLRGAVQYYSGDWDSAGDEWQSVLDLPENERHYRSTWAAYMLGKLYLDTDPSTAIDYFWMVRDLVDDGFADSLGLAHASIGWEARAERNLGNYADAIELYYNVFDGDSYSLRSTIRWAFEAGPHVIQEITASDVARKVTNIYVACNTVSIHNPSQYSGITYDVSWRSLNHDLASMWLDALEQSGKRDSEVLDLLAWASYEAGRFDLAERWLERFDGDNGLTLWLRAKLALRDGDLESAVDYLDLAAGEFDPDVTWVGYEQWDLDIIGLIDTTTIPYQQVNAELGTLQLSMERYTDALDSLLKSGYWWDAAYVAERILTPDELKQFVDENYPEALEDPGWMSWYPYVEMADYEQHVAFNIRYLLARRLTRIGRWQEAREYYPEEHQIKLDGYIGSIRRANNTSLSDSERAEEFWNAALAARYNGMELMGTELEPDFTVVAGNYQPPPVSEIRAGTLDEDDDYSFIDVSDIHSLTAITSQELRRIAASRDEIDPYKRFHYRYIAHEYAWNCVNLMPDEDELTAERMCIAGNWLLNWDEEATRPWYRALVNRCGTTETGREALETGRLPDCEYLDE